MASKGVQASQSKVALSRMIVCSCLTQQPRPNQVHTAALPAELNLAYSQHEIVSDFVRPTLMWLEAKGKANLTALVNQYSLNQNIGEQRGGIAGVVVNGCLLVGRAHNRSGCSFQNLACNFDHVLPPPAAACLTEKREGCPGISNDQLNTTAPSNSTAPSKASGRRLRA